MEIRFVGEFSKQTTPAENRPEYKHSGYEVSGKFGPVYFNLDIRRTTIEIVEMNVSSDQRGKGYGSLAIDWIRQLAASHGMTVFAIPESFDRSPLNTESLAEWYTRHGIMLK